MREGWKEVELGYVCNYVKDKTSFLNVNERNYISADNMVSNFGGITNSEYVPSKGTVSSFKSKDILVSNIRPYFKKIWYASFDGGCSNDVFILRTDEKNAYSKFLFYLISQQEFFDYMMAGANGTKMPRGNKNSIIKFKFLLPPLETQRKIAKILSNYDDLIENNLKRIKILEEMAQQTYEEWFVRMRFPGYETTKINETTGLPEGWERVKLGDLGDVITGKTPSTSVEEYYNGNIPFIKTPDMNGAVYIVETNQNLSEIGSDIQKGKILDKNDLVVSCIGTAGCYALVSKPSQFNQQINAIRFKRKEYIYFTFCFSKGLKEILEALGSNGATMTNVNKGKFEQIGIILPNKDLLNKFHSLAEPVFQLILNLQNQNQRLREARDILLPRLMMGLLNVDDIDL